LVWFVEEEVGDQFGFVVLEVTVRTDLLCSDSQMCDLPMDAPITDVNTLQMEGRRRGDTIFRHIS